jgi:uncharacterized membrane protein YhaH (DUF805 family)
VKTLSSEQAEPLTLAMKYVAMPGWMVGVVAFGSVVAHTAVLLVFQLGQPRIFFAMSRDGLLPKWFAKVHPRYGTPYTATIVTGLVVGVTSMFTSLDDMVDLTNIGTLFAFILVCIGIMILRVREPERERPFRVPGGTYLLPTLGAISCLGLAYYLPPKSWLRFVAWLAAGLIVYSTYGLRTIIYSGRLRRLGYFIGLVVTTAAVFALLKGVDFYQMRTKEESAAYFTIGVVILAAMAAIGILTVRRLHDLGRPGTHYWWLWVPIYDVYFLLVLLLKAGTDGPNRFDAIPASPPPARRAPALPPDYNPEQQLPESDVHERR